MHFVGGRVAQVGQGVAEKDVRVAPFGRFTESRPGRECPYLAGFSLANNVNARIRRP